ncbi:MAG: ABC transporter ATP-binding protein [Fuerstiella sp.]|nr:ABC transporter ATP-binding protein [Fuerstiella sp.]
MVRLDHVSKAYDGTLVVDGVSLTVTPSTTLVLIGPSGCGKSTLLRMVAGLVPPDSGSIFVTDRPMKSETRSEIRNRLGYVIQDGGLFPHLTVRENMTIRSRLARWSAERIESRVLELAELTRFPLAGLERYPAQLSGGQRQRVGIMRALMTDPEVLLLDEPLAALDPMIRRDLQDDLRQIFSTLGKTVIFVTHDLHEAAWFADQIVLLKSGQIEQVGSAAELANAPASEFVSQFVRAQRTSDFGAAVR